MNTSVISDRMNEYEAKFNNMYIDFCLLVSYNVILWESVPDINDVRRKI